MIETSIFTLLKTLVGNRCYPLVMPQNPTLPAIVYQRIASAPSNTLATPPTIDQVRLQIDSYAATYSEAKSTALSVRNAMESATFKATLQSDDDSYEPETRLYRVSMDFYVYERI